MSIPLLAHPPTELIFQSTKMPSGLASPLLKMQLDSPQTSLATSKEFVIQKRSNTTGRIRNLRTGEPEFEDRPLPAGEHPLEYFITDYTVIMDSFAAPCREGRLPEEEVNWLVEAKGTPKRGSEKVQRVTRRPAGLFGHLECLSPSTTSYPQPVEAYLAK